MTYSSASQNLVTLMTPYQLFFLVFLYLHFHFTFLCFCFLFCFVLFCVVYFPLLIVNCDVYLAYCIYTLSLVAETLWWRLRCSPRHCSPFLKLDRGVPQWHHHRSQLLSLSPHPHCHRGKEVLGPGHYVRKKRQQNHLQLHPGRHIWWRDRHSEQCLSCVIEFGFI